MRWLKQQLRQKILTLRSQIDPSQQQHLSFLIAQRCFHQTYFKLAQRIAFYHAFKGEVSAQPIIERALQIGKSCYLPVLEKDTLKFVQITALTRYTKNRFGILEPSREHAQILPATALDLVFVPLVAFDVNGWRLGMGGGLYDRSFAFRRHIHKPQLVGLAYEFQKLNQVPHTNLDVLLDEVITEKQVYRVRQAKNFPP